MGPVRADERDRDPDRAPCRDDARAGARPPLRAGAAARGRRSKLGQPWKLDGTRDAARFARRRLAAPRASRSSIAAAIVDEKRGHDRGRRHRRARRPALAARAVRADEQVRGRGGARRSRPPRAAPTAAALTPALAARRDPFRFELVETSVDDRVATLTINRPDALNALNEDVVAQLEAAFESSRASPASRRDRDHRDGQGVRRGRRRPVVRESPRRQATSDIVAFTARGQAAASQVATSPKVVIAKLDGLSLGGGSELALACD